MLVVLDGKASPSMLLQLNVNAIASAFVTVAYLLITAPLTSCLAQLKWNQYCGRVDSLMKFQDLDEASRSVQGSLKLLFRRRWNVLAVLAALNFICIQAIGPFVQLIVSVEQRTLLVPGVAKMPMATSMDVELGGTYRQTFQNIVIANQASPTCPFGNCTWDPYWSVGLEAECRDTSHLLTQINSTSPQVFRLPNGHLLDESPVGDFNRSFFDLNVSAVSDLMIFKNRTNVFLGLSIIYHIPDWQLYARQAAIAQECIFSLVGEYSNTTVINSVMNTTVLKRSYFDVPLARSPWANAVKAIDLATGKRCTEKSCYVTTNSSLIEDGVELKTMGLYMESLSSAMIPAMHGARGVMMRKDTSLVGTEHVRVVSSQFAIDPLFTFGANNNAQADRTFLIDLRKRVNSIATEVTAILGQKKGTVQVGSGSVLAVFTVVRWPWVSLPLALLFVSGVLLAVVVCDTEAKGVPVWKDSALAIIATSLASADRRDLDRVARLTRVTMSSKDHRLVIDASNDVQ